VYHFDTVCTDPLCSVREWLDEPDPVRKEVLESNFYKHWWNESPPTDGEREWTKGCKKCHCADPNDECQPGCVPYNHLILPTLNNLQKAANHLGLLLNRGDPLPGMTVPQNRARRVQRMDQIAFKGYEE
jgi:hypothetical protein